MAAFQTFMRDILARSIEFLDNEVPHLNAIFEEAKDYCPKVSKEIEKCKKTGVFSVKDPSSWNTSSEDDRRNSSKENAEPNKNSMANSRPKRNAFKESNQANIQSDIMQGKNTDQLIVDNVKVKTEKKSIPKESSDDQVDLARVKQEMPAPTQLPPRRRKVKAEPVSDVRSTRSRAKRTDQSSSDTEKEKPSKRTKKKTTRLEDRSEERKDSDVILQNDTLTTVDLSDTDSASENTILKNTEPSQVDSNSRTTRTKTRNKKLENNLLIAKESEEIVKNKNNKPPIKTKRGHQDSSDEDSSSQKQDKRVNKRSRSNSDGDENNTDLPKIPPQAKSTKVIENENNNVESTQRNTEVIENVTNGLIFSDKSNTENKTQAVTKKNADSGSRDVLKNKVDNKPESPNNEQIMDTTVVIEKPKYTTDTLKTLEKDQGAPNKILNETIVISKGGNNLQNGINGMIDDDLMTDDESEEEIKSSSPVKTNAKKVQGKGIKQIFSPFDPSPVKKKVEAFERLGAEASAIPRITRTKTRAQAKEQKEDENKEIDSDAHSEEPKNNVREKAKLFTPTIPRFIPKTCSTSKLNHKLPSHCNSILNDSSNVNSILSTKSASALKSSQAEFRERERLRREKEAEALKKREAMIQAQIEEKKRKREEKQMKAQQQREALEKESQKKLEAQKIKEEKYKKMIQEKEEKLQKQREELERKRLMAKKKALEEKKKEEAKKAEEQKKADETFVKVQKDKEYKPQPIYMTTRAPLLPTEDCYDSDDAEYQTHRPRQPEWSGEYELRTIQLCMIAAGEKLKNTFFSIQAHSPDLQEIFELIDPRKLKRTSSAIWRKPPRYTLMPTLDHHIEDSDEEYYDD